MIEMLKAWAVTLCAGAVVAALAKMLIPSGKMVKMFQMVLGVFFLCCLISPFLSMRGLSLNLDVSSFQEEVAQTSGQLADQVNAQIRSQIEKRISALAQESLDALQVRPKKITVDMDIAEDGGISMKQVTVLLTEKDASKKEAVGTALQSALGLNPVVTVAGE